VGQVIFLRLGLGQPPLGLENFPPKILIFTIFGLVGTKRHRTILGQPLNLLRASSILGSDQVKVDMGPDLTRAYFCPAVIKRPARL